MTSRDYSEQFKIQIGTEMMKKHRIYLDTKYWIFMRDACSGKSCPEHISIYKSLKSLVQYDLAICPLSPHVFQELMSIGDSDKRLQTANVMDELSKQITFISPLNIFGQELISFLRNCQNKVQGKAAFNPSKYVWTKVPFILGEILPYYSEFTKAQNENIQIEFLKYISKYSLAQMIEYIKDFPVHKKEDLINGLNEGKDKHQEWNSFHEVFMAEVAGVLDIVDTDIEEVWKFLYFSENGEPPLVENSIKADYIQKTKNIIYNAFKLKKMDRELPFIHISASLHALFRYNKQQRFKENDLVDISHASWALPYCDIFLTERKLANWVCNPLLRLNQRYDTAVIHNEEDALKHLNKLHIG